jgi:autotransporter adhesin
VFGFANSSSGTASGNAVVGIANSSAGTASGNFVVGVANNAFGTGSGNAVQGIGNTGVGTGSGNGVLGVGNTSIGLGSGNNVSGSNNLALGTEAGNGINANDTIAVGTRASASSDNSIAIGKASSATGRNATAVGANTQAKAPGSVALGTDSAGNGAVAFRHDQFVLGTRNHTYTAPGITSGLSRARQSGPLEVVTSDIHGNLATDGGLLFDEISKAGGGIAVAIALENPDLVAGERFGIAANVGIWEDNVALGFTAIGVLGHNFVGYGERWALSGGVGFSVREESFGRRGDESSVGGRAGLQVSW